MVNSISSYSTVQSTGTNYLSDDEKKKKKTQDDSYSAYNNQKNSVSENNSSSHITEDTAKSTAQSYIASLKGNFGYAEQAKNQNYDHMPAAQWYISQNGTSETAPITITNREFSDLWTGGQVQAFKAADGQVFFRSGNLSGDTLEFIPVSASSKKEEKLGYKHVDEKQASIETYYFNYLHGLALDKGLNTPIDNDSFI